jgi:hypothetical protein
MKRYKLAAILMIIHGGLMELSVALALIPLLILGINASDSSHYFSFVVTSPLRVLTDVKYALFLDFQPFCRNNRQRSLPSRGALALY